MISLWTHHAVRKPSAQPTPVILREETLIIGRSSPSRRNGGRINVFLYVDGAYMNSQVMLNTECIGKNPYGYTPFCVELTPWLLEQNHLEIGTRCCQPNSRWYTGGGLYRQVEIWLGDSLFIHPWSVQVLTESVKGLRHAR